MTVERDLVALANSLSGYQSMSRRSSMTGALSSICLSFVLEPVRRLRAELASPLFQSWKPSPRRECGRDFALALLDEGVLPLPDGRWYLSTAHSDEDIDRTLAAVERDV